MASELRLFQNYLGGRRTYTTPAASTVVTDGATNTNTTVTSATAAFTAADVGAPISGGSIPAGAYITVIGSATSVTISAAATTTATAVTLTISRHLVFHSAALAAMSTVGTTQHMMVGFDPDGMAGEPEVVKITKHDASATWAQITRAQEGTTARAHSNSGGGADWIHGAFAIDVGPTWVEYTPVWAATGTAPVIGNGSIQGWYLQQGKLLQVQITMLFGSTTTFGTGQYTFGLPTNMVAATWTGLRQGCGSVYGLDSGAAHQAGTVYIASAGTTVSAVSHAGAAEWGQAQPITWGNADGISLTATVRLA